MSRLCREHGLDTPRTEVVRLAGGDPIAPSEIPFPVVAKPAVSAGYYPTLMKGFKKVYYATAQSELDELWRDLRALRFVLFDDIIPHPPTPVKARSVTAWFALRAAPCGDCRLNAAI